MIQVGVVMRLFKKVPGGGRLGNPERQAAAIVPAVRHAPGLSGPAVSQARVYAARLKRMRLSGSI